MLARDVMKTRVLSATPEQNLEEALTLMRKHKLRMLPVVDTDGHLCGAITTINILCRLLPDYILSGSLGDVAYAPDIAVLPEHYARIIARQVADVMDRHPLIVQEDESLLAVAASLAADEQQHLYALVVGADHELLGVISPGDILDHFHHLHLSNSKT